MIVDLFDCSTTGKCAECRDNLECPSGRCDNCTCQSRVGAGQNCDEDSDCTGSKCGPGMVPSPLDCTTTGKCAECRSNSECPSGRCDGCSCQATVGNGQNCDEDGDCTSKRCGPGAYPFDCTTTGKCAECRSDGDCPSGRCDSCGCLPKLDGGQSCNEDSDCKSGNCNGASKCT